MSVIGGLASDLARLQRLVLKLAENRRVISFDNWEVGRSDNPDIPSLIEMLAADASVAWRRLRSTDSPRESSHPILNRGDRG